MGQTAKELYAKLKQMNSTEIAPTERMRMLALMDQPLQFVLQTLAEHYLREPPPLSKRNKTAAELVTALCTLVVQAYKLALNQFHHESLAGRVLHKGGRAEAIHKVIYFLGQMLLRSFQLYQPAPKWLWHETHGLYSYAADHNLHEKPLENEDPRVGDLQTATSLYKQILLLSLSGPYRMLQGEVERVYFALQRWAPKSNLIELGKADGDTGLFLVDSKADEAPRYKGLGSDEQVERGWILDTQGLAEFLAEELERVNSSAVPVGSNRPMSVRDSVSSDLLARLMLTWGIGAKRATDRTESTGDVILYSGLENVYAVMGGSDLNEVVSGGYGVNAFAGEGEEEPVPRHPEFDEHVVEGAGHLTGFSERAAQEELEKPVEVFDRGDEIEGEPARDCWIIDESQNGFHLGWFGSGRTSVHVGDLVAVQKRISGLLGDLHLGVIRWLMSEGGDTIDFGVELFQGDTVPVGVNRQRASGDMEIIPGLLQSSQAGSQSLITEPFFSAEDDKITLIYGNKEHKINLNKMLDGSASFVQVSFDEMAVSDAIVEEVEAEEIVVEAPPLSTAEGGRPGFRRTVG
ncbi:hypothetical protein BOW51_01895 [Solemya velesiana gill symbiont]|uniref:GTPase n=1 Tax=Solemya velesiana gill symbiont TaxID=1918948 RepID=A0A1T2KXC4_9GAMM|nr:hypothetical protein BOW51_01895 [Solemya velesiana gill symbiont]